MSEHVTRYGTVTKVFHWITALLILALIPLGVIANRLPYETSAELAQKAQLFSWHKSLGVLVFFVALARILWALTQSKPGPLHPARKAETFLAETVHWLLYGSLVVAPLSGWIHHAATTGFAPIWWPFGQSLPLVPKDESIAHLFGSVHWVMTKVMVGALLLHVAGAVKHHVIDRDATLSRMWFGDRDVPQVPPHRTVIAAPLTAVAIFAATAFAAVAMADNKESGPATASLADVSSDWAVEDGGRLAITITQLGSEVTGTFADWTAQITFDPANGPEFGNVVVTIAIGSLTLGSVTDQAMGPDYFDAATFPTATFAGPITQDAAGQYLVEGELTLKGVSRPATLAFALTEQEDGAMKMTGAAQIDRKTFGIGLNQTDADTLGFGVEVAVSLSARKAQ